MSVAIVDDHRLFRESLCALMATWPGVEVAWAAGTAREALRAASAVEPDVFLMDLKLSGEDGTAAIRELLRVAPARRVLVVTAYDNPEYLEDSVAAGARGYLLKDDAATSLREAIEQVARGQAYFTPVLVREGRPLLMQRPARRGRTGGALRLLSPREREVFHLLARGNGNTAIAQALSVSVKTVETHRAHLFKKLGLHSLPDLVRYAARHGLLPE